MARRGRELDVWLEGVRVAQLVDARSSIRCRYSKEALQRWPLNSPVLSCSLPLDSRPLNATPFCVGLLPEGQALQTMAANAGLAATDTFGLLARYGRDVAGALVITAAREEPDPSEFRVEPYDSESLAEAVAELDDFPLGTHEDSELSLAGIQDKLLLVRDPDGRWGRPIGGLPSTHILKRDDPRYPGLVEAEAHCLLLARAVGLTSIDVELAELGFETCLIVSRFDRVVEDETVRRVHQEDLCQALGIDPSGKRGRAKYERAGGPSLRQAAELLDTYAADPQAALDRLIRIIAFTVLIGNADAHGKNLGLLHSDGESIALSPLYDTVPTLLWPQLRKGAAMAVGGQPMLEDIGLDDIGREAARWKRDPQRARALAEETIEGALAAVEEGVIPAEGRTAELVRRRGASLLGKAAASRSLRP
ncbi:MAG: HipA domain-containing protein [Solirubrobacterales bacterium]